MRSAPISPCLRLLPAPVQALVQALEERNPATAAHGRRVATLALQLAEFSHRLARPELEQVFLAGYLHDLGKLVVPVSILEKPGPLDRQEWEIVHMATTCGESLLKPYFPPGDPLVEAIRNAREHWDGTGSPDGLRADDIPPTARIVLIADTLDALSMHTAYRRPSGRREALKVLASGAGSQFDPAWVELALRLWGEGVRRPGPAPTPIPFLHSDRQLHFEGQRRRAA